MNIAHGNAHNYAGRACKLRLYNGRVVAAAFAHGRLRHKAVFLRRIKRKTLEAGVAYNRFVHVAEHGAFFHNGLHGVSFAERIVCGAAFVNYCNIRPYLVHGNLAAALAYFLLRGQYAYNVHVQLHAAQKTHCLYQRGAAYAAVEPLAEHNVPPFVVFKRGCGHGGFAYAYAECFLGFLRAAGANVYNKI